MLSCAQLRTGWAKRYAGWQEQGAWQSRVPGSGQMDLNMLRVADNMGNDGNTREEGMVLMAPVLVQAWCGPPYAVRSTTCCGMGGLALHSMDIGARRTITPALPRCLPPLILPTGCLP